VPWSSRTDLEHLPPSWRASIGVVSSDICDEDLKKHDYTRSI
jgi:hypothetical protein